MKINIHLIFINNSDMADLSKWLFWKLKTINSSQRALINRKKFKEVNIWKKNNLNWNWVFPKFSLCVI